MDMATLLQFRGAVTNMVLLIMLVTLIGLSLVGSRALLWTVLFLMTRQIVRNVNMTGAFNRDTEAMRFPAHTV